MSRTEITEKLMELFDLAMCERPEGGIDENMRLKDDLGLSSVGILYIVIGIEEMFSIRFEGVGFADFVTLGDVITYIEEKLNK